MVSFIEAKKASAMSVYINSCTSWLSLPNKGLISTYVVSPRNKYNVLKLNIKEIFEISKWQPKKPR